MLSRSFADTCDILVGLPRPVLVRFEDPYAVSADVARCYDPAGAAVAFAVPVTVGVGVGAPNTAGVAAVSGGGYPGAAAAAGGAWSGGGAPAPAGGAGYSASGGGYGGGNAVPGVLAAAGRAAFAAAVSDPYQGWTTVNMDDGTCRGGGGVGVGWGWGGGGGDDGRVSSLPARAQAGRCT